MSGRFNYLTKRPEKSLQLTHKMSVANRVIKNTGFLYAKMGITMFISLYSTRLILNALGAEDFGIYNVVGGAITMLSFLNAALATATQRFMSYSTGEDDLTKQTQIFNVSIILHFVIAFFVAISLSIAGHFFFNGILNISPERVQAAKFVYYFMVLSTVLSVMTVPFDAVLNAHENMLYFSIVGVIESVLKLGAAFLVVYYMQDKLILYGVAMAAVAFTIMLIEGIYCYRRYDECRFNPGLYWSKSLMKSMTKFAGWNLLTTSSSMISQYGLSIVLNNYFGTLLNAAQGIANQISGQLMTFSNTMMKALNPVIAKSEGSGERKKMLEASMVGAKFSYLLLAFFAVPFIIEAPYILKLWLKNVPEWAVLFTQLQLLRSLTEQWTFMISGTISAQGDIKSYSIVRSILFILPIILTIIFFQFNFPPYSLYIVWILCWSILGGWATLFFSNKKCDLNYSEYVRKVMVPTSITTLAMIIVGILPTFILDSGLIRIILTCFSSTIAFLLSYSIFFLTIKEKEVISSILSGVFIKITGRIKASTAR